MLVRSCYMHQQTRKKPIVSCDLVEDRPTLKCVFTHYDPASSYIPLSQLRLFSHIQRNALNGSIQALSPLSLLLAKSIVLLIDFYSIYTCEAERCCAHIFGITQSKTTRLPS